MHRALSAAGVALSLLVAASVYSPATARADDAAMARFHYQEASRYYGQRRYEQAIQQFFLAQRLSPNPRTLYNIGLCFFQLGRREQSHQFLGEYLGQQDDVEGAAERRAFAERTLAEMAPHLALVRVQSEPAGARIFVDREELGAYGTTPRVIALPPGAHEVWVELDGHRRATTSVEAILGTEVAISLSPERILGTLRVRASAAARARVIDAEGRVVAEDELPLEVRVPPGRYDVDVLSEGRRPWHGIELVHADQTSSVEAPLEILAAELTVTANHLDAEVVLDGEVVGNAPLPLSDLTPGPHRLGVRAAGMFPWEQQVDLAPDSRAWVTVMLEPQPDDRSVWTWITGGTGVALLVAGAVTGVSALVLRDQLLDLREAGPGARPRDQPGLESFASEVDGLATSTDVILGAGALLTGIGVVLYFATDPQNAERSSASINRSRR